MKKILACISMVLCGWAAWAVQTTEQQIDSLTAVFDEEVANYKVYINQRENTIANLKKELESVATDENRAAALMKELFLAYKPYQTDSAIVYLKNRLELAFSINNQRIVDDTRLLQLDYYASIGLYHEGYIIVNLLDTANFDKEQKLDFLEYSAHLYGEMAVYTEDEHFSMMYRNLANKNSERLLCSLDPTSTRYYNIMEGLLWYHTPDKALEVNSLLMASTPETSPEYAVRCFMRALEYSQKGDKQMSRLWYLKSALCDVRAGITDNGSSWNLAKLLFEAGDVERAYTYASYSMENALTYHARIRQAQVANSWSIIEKQYQANRNQRSQMLLVLLILVSLLALAMIAVFVVLITNRKKILLMQRQLQSANDQLKSANDELTGNNTDLSRLNAELSDANRAKEENIGYVLSLCSSYIDKLDKYRKLTAKRVTNKKYDEILADAKNPDYIDRELEEFYHNFDENFLSIYPNFVEEFNNLLLEEEQIVLKGGELLNAELRIFALIRLGVDNSSKIAELLRYSVNTIYNYRAKVKNKAKGNRDQFEEDVKRIGLN